MWENFYWIEKVLNLLHVVKGEPGGDPMMQTKEISLEVFVSSPPGLPISDVGM